MISRVRGLRRLSLLLSVVPLLTSCTEPWEDGGLMPVAPSSDPVPSVVAPTTTGPAAPEAIESVSACSLLGVLITAERGDAAAGYREMVLNVKNCGSKPYEVRGRPDIVVLDEDGRPLKVAVVPSVHYTEGPGRLVLKPGEGARAVLSWRNTVTDTGGGADFGVSLAVAVSKGGMRQLVTLPSRMDLGNTRRLQAGVWS
jgi:hypothetical protein